MTTLVVGILFTPLPALEMSVVDYVMASLRGFQANSTYMLSLP